MEQNSPAGQTDKRLKIAVGILLAVVVLFLAILTATRAIKINRMGYGAGYKGGVMMDDKLISQRGAMMDSVVSAPTMMGATEPAVGGFSGKQIALSEAAPAEAPDKQVIKNGSLDLRVNDADDTLQKVGQVAAANGGEIFSSSFFQTEKNVKSGSIQVKVPADKFEKTFAELKKVATLVIQESTSGQDVTMEYADLQSQLRNKRAEEQSYLKILDQAQKVSDIIEVTQQLSMVRGEIERIQGQIKFMDSQTKMASIFISLTEDQNITVTDSWRPLQVAKDAVNKLVRGAQGFVNSIITFAIVVVPIFILYAVLFYGLYWLGKLVYRKIKERKNVA